MKFYHLITCLLVIALFEACDSQPPSAIPLKNDFNLPDSLSARRLGLVMALRDSVANSSWEGFNQKRVEGPFNYYHGKHSEIFFPDSLVLSKLTDIQKHSEDYVLTERTDTIPYHFELMISFDPADSTKYYFEHPVQQFLSVEETRQFIPSVSSTEWWATMVIHEMFHHYQYNQPAFLAYARSTIGQLPFDVRDLRQLYREDTLFMNMIRKENSLLLKALEEREDDRKRALLGEYLNSRNRRISKYETVYEHLEQVENYYVIQEGAARYIEYQAMQIMEDWAQSAEAPTVENDTLFNGFKEFGKIDLADEEFNFLTYAGPDTWHYAIGFNLMRVLDQLQIEYKPDLFDHPEKGLPGYLPIQPESSDRR